MKCKYCKSEFIPRKPGQKFCKADHRIKANNAKNKLVSGKQWKEIQQKLARLAKLESPQFRRYLKYESRINAWLKANKK